MPEGLPEKFLAPPFFKKRVAPATHEGTGGSVSDREEEKVCFSSGFYMVLEKKVGRKKNYVRNMWILSI